MTQRECELSRARMAGANVDKAAFTRLLVEAKSASRKALRQAWRDGWKAKHGVDKTDSRDTFYFNLNGRRCSVRAENQDEAYRKAKHFLGGEPVLYAQKCQNIDSVPASVI